MSGFERLALHWICRAEGNLGVLRAVMEFVKDTPCDSAGTTRAYEIINARIISWLKAQFGLPETQ